MRKKRTPVPVIADMPAKRDHRAYAHKQATFGIAVLAHAVNAWGDPATPYRYDDVSQSRFRAMAQLMMELIEDGKIIEPSEQDMAFQRFMKSVVCPQTPSETKSK